MTARHLRPALAALLAGLGLGAAPPAPPIDIVVTREAGGRWTADIDFNREAGAWVFLRPAGSGPPGPPLSRRWAVETPGLALSRRGPFDVLSAADGAQVPEKVRIAMGPIPPAEGPPFNGFTFSDGALAFYTGQFLLLARGSAAEAEALPPVVVGQGFPRTAMPPVHLTFKDPDRPILWRGRVEVGEASGPAGPGGYAVFGRARTGAAAGVLTVQDRGLPEWLARQIDDFLPRLLGFYGAALGERTGEAPTIAMAWVGARVREAGFEGRVAPGAVSLRFAGDGLVRPRSPEYLAARRFLAHEVAHFWLGQTAIPRRPVEAWTYEGGAEMMAAFAMAATFQDFDPRSMLQAELDQCLALTRGRPFAAALAPAGGSRGPYACGAVLALAAEAATAKAKPGGRPLAFHRALIARARVQGGLFDQDDWLEVLARETGSPEASDQVRALIAGEGLSAEAGFARLFTVSGVPHRADGRGRIRLQRPPRALFTARALPS